VGGDSETFVFDPADNLIGSQAGGSGGYAVGDRLLVYGDRAFEYDPHGNRVRERRGTSGPVLSEYVYDGNNQLRAAREYGRQEGQITRFGYDALGRRAWKDTIHSVAAANDDDGPSPASRRTQFLWNGDVLLAESDQTDDPLATVYLFEPLSFRPLAQVRRASKTARAGIYHYHLDSLGTPQEVTNENGELAWAVSYKAWGGVARTMVAEIPQPLRFQGQYYDSETGLHYNRARYYSPAEGRFIQHDPLRLIAGPNLASYAPNPIQYVDPWGLAPCNVTADSRGEAFDLAKDRAGIPRSQEPIRQGRFSDQPPYTRTNVKEYSPGSQGRWYQYERPGQNDAYVVEHPVDPNQDPHFHAVTSKPGHIPVHEGGNYAPIDGDHHIYYPNPKTD
jgi:RHS repeat-associated protein